MFIFLFFPGEVLFTIQLKNTMGIIVMSQQGLPISARLSKSQDDLRRLCCTIKKKVKITKRGLVGDGEFHPCPNSISSATKSKLSDNHALHSSAMATKFPFKNSLLTCLSNVANLENNLFLIQNVLLS